MQAVETPFSLFWMDCGKKARKQKGLGMKSEDERDQTAKGE